MSGVELSPLFVGYLLAFTTAAIACFGSVRKVSQISDPDTRRGLTALLMLSGGWAVSQVGYFVAEPMALKHGFYLVGLIIGFTTVGPWLYFCSAYTGRSLHRNPTVRTLAVVAVTTITVLKLTHPFHNLFYTTTFVTTPFPHLAIQHGIAHWVVMGLSYALAAIGYFMLFELFTQIDTETRQLAALVGVAGLPALLNIASLTHPALLSIPYEPLGVAAFAVGLSVLMFDRFQSIQLAGDHDQPVVVLDDDDRIRDYNREASGLFPALVGSVGAPLADTLPTVAERLGESDPVLSVDTEEADRYYKVVTNPFFAHDVELGRLLVFSDITNREAYRRELESQNDRLDEFAQTISHDLRNPLNVASGRLELACRDCDSEHLAPIADAHDRMEEIIDETLALAQDGELLAETEPVDLVEVVTECWDSVQTEAATIQIETPATITADRGRLKQLLENLFRNSVEHGLPAGSPSKDESDDAGDGGLAHPDSAESTGLTIRVGMIHSMTTTTRSSAANRYTGFYVEDNGPGIPESERDAVFDPEYSTGGTGLGLSIVSDIVQAHDWSVRVTEGRDGGARFEITGVDIDG